MLFQFKHTCMFLTRVEYSDLKKGFQQEKSETRMRDLRFQRIFGIEGTAKPHVSWPGLEDLPTVNLLQK